MQVEAREINMNALYVTTKFLYNKFMTDLATTNCVNSLLFLDPYVSGLRQICISGLPQSLY